MLGIAGGALLAGQEIGAALFAIAIAGGSAFIALMRAGQALGPATERAWNKAWGWAGSVGVDSDLVLRPSRELGTKLWVAAGGGGKMPPPFTTKARSRARAMLHVITGLLLVGAAGIVIGFADAAMEWGESKYPQLTDPTYTPTPFEFEP